MKAKLAGIEDLLHAPLPHAIPENPSDSLVQFPDLPGSIHYQIKYCRIRDT